MPEIWDKLYEANRKQGLPLHLGEPEVNYAKAYAPAIFPFIEQDKAYDYYEKYSDEPPEELMSAGNSSSAYAAQYGTVSLVTELPYFYDPRIESEKELDFTRGEAAKKNAEMNYALDKEMDKLYSQIKDYVADDNPHVKMVAISLKNYQEHYESTLSFIEGNEMYDEPCKESEAFDNLELPKFYSLFYWTLLRRSCEHELAKGDVPGKETLQKVYDIADERFEKIAADVEESFDYVVIPIKKLVSVQLESGLIVAERLKELAEAEKEA